MIVDRTDDQIERDVRHIRTTYSICDSSPIDPMTIIVKLKERRVDFDYVRVSVSEMGSTEAEWDSQNNILRIREDIYRGMNAGLPRALYVFAHELAHYFYEHDGIRRRSSSREIYEKAVAKIRRQERLAERFAARFLAPLYLVQKGVTVDELRRRFCLSERAAEIRREEIERHFRIESGEKRPIPSFFDQFMNDLKSGRFPPTQG
jgi:hypothetical protein